ncbi:MAG: glycoside hydrolase family 9 protein [Clostridia bacterium]|nr:glycoside hydrolase family 9 protein [Clostridia bacterium]
MDAPSKIRVNQVGYALHFPQIVTVLTDSPLILRDACGKELGRIAPPPLQWDEASGERAASVSLSLPVPGTYELEADGERRKITVEAAPWRSVTNALIKGLYYQRCGCALAEVHAGPYAHPACHTAPAVDWENRNVQRKVTGGWHDAGDYGKYVGPGAVTAAHLLYAWKLFSDGCSDQLNIPESGNGIPDILNEARWELEWILQMQRADGAFYHKLTKARFAPFIMPQEDRETEYLMPVSSCATGAACACLSLASRVFRAFDAPFANRMLLSALRAWDWLQNHPEFVPFQNPEGVRTGQYGDKSDADERFWAACELLASTGQERFREAAEALYAAGQRLTAFGWANVGGLGALCSLFDLKEKAGHILYDALKKDFLEQSEEALALSRKSGFGTALSPDRYIWGSILPVMGNAMTMILNALITGREDMRNAALLQWHYALGMNALDLCFVTGFGEKRVLHPHHRLSGADGINAPVPGLISGGPNKRFPYPATKEKLGEETPPAKYFLDETPSADTNEIAIYWNSPAIFVGAYFNMLA